MRKQTINHNNVWHTRVAAPIPRTNLEVILELYSKSGYTKRVMQKSPHSLLEFFLGTSRESFRPPSYAPLQHARK